MVEQTHRFTDDQRRNTMSDNSMPSSVVEQVLAFGNLHIRTCGGADAVTFDMSVEEGEPVLHQRCHTCGAVLSLAVSMEETEALGTLAMNTRMFQAAMRL
jgi:hypothetical protein